MKSHTPKHPYTHTLNNAEGIIAGAGVLNELCEEGIYSQQFTWRDLRHLCRKSCGIEIKLKKIISWRHMMKRETYSSLGAVKIASH